MRILITEDDAMIGTGVQQALRQEGYAADWAQDAVAARLALETTAYDLLLLDLNLPRGDGLSLLRHLRQQGQKLPVLIMTARDTVPERIAGLDAGADDYLVKPFDLDELSARVRALLRRQRGEASNVLALGELSIDTITHHVWLDKQQIKMSAREYAILLALMEHPGQPHSRSQLEERIYGWDEEVESNAIEVHIHALRKKLGSERIRNLRGVGYFITDPQKTV